ERHQGGIHFTSENDIMKIIRPTISRYWEEKIEAVSDLKELEKLKIEMRHYQVLDPACGSGNFLYMAYQELKQAEHLLLQKSAELKGTEQLEMSFVTPLQFYGIDNNPFAVDLARVTLLIARKVAIDKLGLTENALPLDSLDHNIIQGDALLIDWPQANVIVGNPPFQSKNKMQQEFGAKYVNQIREKYPEIPGRADYCVYWFYKAHQQLPEQGRAGLIGTNTIRENYSREGGLDYIVKNNGTITEAVSTQVWSGDATVRVAIVNWIKGNKTGKKQLSLQLGDRKESPWQVWELDYINSSLSAQVDVSQARKILTNATSKCCYQGQTHGHEDFLLTPDQYLEFVQQNSLNQEVLFPYLTGDDLVSTYPPLPKRYVIDFHPQDLKQASRYKALIKKLKERVLSTREQVAQEEEKRNQAVLKSNPKARVNRHHKNFLAKWWLLSYPRAELIEKLNQIPRYIVCSRVTKRPIFEFINAHIRPNDGLQVFAIADDYSFGILQSDWHWQWFINRCSTLGSGFRYTSDTVFDTFPFPQSPTLEQIQQVAENAVNLRQRRREIMNKNQWSLRELYRNLTDNPQESDSQNLQDTQNSLDQAVAIAYGRDFQIN
ncbi:MAG: DNA methyltransferase, partial [Microcystaceae cyanobacterium]